MLTEAWEPSQKTLVKIPPGSLMRCGLQKNIAKTSEAMESIKGGPSGQNNYNKEFEKYQWVLWSTGRSYSSS
jgi:hypothetical protein